jgi:hypothetical protein
MALPALQASARSSKVMSSASLRETIVPKAGVGSRPVSILRSVSGEMPAAKATSPRLRSARARRSMTPRLTPAPTCSEVSGRRTMGSGYDRLVANRNIALRGIDIPPTAAHGGTS